MFNRGFGSAIRSEGSKETEVFLVVGLVEVAVWALVETTVFLPVSQLIAIGAEGSSAMFFWDLFEISEEW